MKNAKMTLWGKTVSLPVSYNLYPGEEILPAQEEALRWLLTDTAAKAAAKRHAERYIRKDPAAELPPEGITNLFDWVTPTAVFIPHENNRLTAAILCEYAFDPEHGLAVVFDGGKFKAVGPQDIIL